MSETSHYELKKKNVFKTILKVELQLFNSQVTNAVLLTLFRHCILSFIVMIFFSDVTFEWVKLVDKQTWKPNWLLIIKGQQDQKCFTYKLKRKKNGFWLKYFVLTNSSNWKTKVERSSETKAKGRSSFSLPWRSKITIKEEGDLRLPTYNPN